MPTSANSASPPSAEDLCAAGRRVIEIETLALRKLSARIGDAFAAACRLVLACDGRVAVIGMGKSGHVGRKIAATLASTGTPALFVHPGEASHGDLGMIAPGDVVIAISNSGETDEILTIVPAIKRLGTRIIAMTGKPASQLATAADVHIDISVDKEACPLNLAPTASSTATLAMGDAIAIALLEARGFSEDDFAYSHPGGSLGRRLLLRIGQIMHTGDQIPACHPDTLLSDALVIMTASSIGMVIAVSQDEAAKRSHAGPAGGKVLGVFTDGDLRRTLAGRIDLHSVTLREVMTAGGVSAHPEQLATEALRLMEEHEISGMPVVDEQGRLVGALDMHDLLRAGVY